VVYNVRSKLERWRPFQAGTVGGWMRKAATYISEQIPPFSPYRIVHCGVRDAGKHFLIGQLRVKSTVL